MPWIGGRRAEAEPTVPEASLGTAARALGKHAKSGRRSARRMKCRFEPGLETEEGVPVLVRRREPVWLNANRIVASRLRALSRTLASVGASSQKSAEVAGAAGDTAAKPGDQVLASIPDGDTIARRLKVRPPTLPELHPAPGRSVSGYLTRPGYLLLNYVGYE